MVTITDCWNVQDKMAYWIEAWAYQVIYSQHDESYQG